jgi:GGDEF domain-containing protein
VPTYAGVITVNTSIGIAVRSPADTIPTDVIHRAEVDMYEAKSDRGRPAR